MSKPDEIRILLNTAKAHPAKRIQAAADRVFDQLDKLRGLIREDQEKNSEKRKREAEKAAARAEVERLQRQLAEAKAKLRGKPTPTATPPAPPASDHQCDRDDCDRSFVSIQALRMHQRRAHDGFDPNATKAAS